MTSEIANTFVWEIGNFQKWIKVSKGECINSQKFWLPQRSFEINNDQVCNHPTLWELSLYPNGISSKGMSLCVHAIQTKYEKEKGISTRRKQFILGIGEYDISQLLTKRKAVIRQSEKYGNFTFNGSKTISSNRYDNFFSLDYIFSRNEKAKVVNLFVQVTILEEKSIPVDRIKFDNKYEDCFGDDSFSDIEFELDCGSRIKAHRVILSSSSSYFKIMFSSQWKERDMDVVPIRETNYTSFRAILYFIYSGKLLGLESFDEFEHAFKLADMMMLKNLNKLVINEWLKIVDNENWHKFILLGWKYNNNLLKNTGLEYAADHWEKVKKDDGMLQLIASNNIEGIEELFYITNKRLEMSNVGIILERQRKQSKTQKQSMKKKSKYKEYIEREYRACDYIEVNDDVNGFMLNELSYCTEKTIIDLEDSE
ncbi:8397_t:CDS:1 [Funneliformis geosporum]|uniref:18193_t:CDS:1 n=1 Tax=Funneliformis geosporum TaxID=1117311 RepID=A0A9W4SUS8_9GLOM|nr:18193_t:CDS:1 [Funneliformis geosporum]CAI2181733.1 8397_t:CDS:1 [Funneliformis geosporum]